MAAWVTGQPRRADVGVDGASCFAPRSGGFGLGNVIEGNLFPVPHQVSLVGARQQKHIFDQHAHALRLGK